MIENHIELSNIPSNGGNEPPPDSPSPSTPGQDPRDDKDS